ncbi:acetyl-CoA carboxylase [Caballeronia sp. dw_276]|jgi:biotin carboxyl carrier protein|uniref:acetyl-CoA carboxylase n=1 Tax=Caballeronia sp. dw_276 TaxID=2719795 RepID=UPI001BD23B42|nr:acetyl-CoA carboxylase [Caballeronia sp. dw_276]
MADFEVKSEIPGTFYRSSAPGKPPLVEEGQSVSADTVIGIVELMKQFNDVLAGVAGVVRSFAVADGDAVDADAVLVVIDTGSA